jgi:prevent-host-death family protein
MRTLPLSRFRDSASECVREAERTGERIAITRHGQVVAYLVPAKAGRGVRQHPMFGSLADDPRTPDEILADLRKPRHAV